jgi:hypothetical protein
MNKDWEKIDELFHQALECPNDERAEFMARAAQSDPALGGKLQALLEAHEKNHRGIVREQAGDAAGALSDFTQAIKLDRRLHEAWTAGRSGCWLRPLPRNQREFAALCRGGLARGAKATSEIVAPTVTKALRYAITRSAKRSSDRLSLPGAPGCNRPATPPAPAAMKR